MILYTHLFQELGGRCQEILIRQLTVSNALELLQLALLHRGQELERKALQTIGTNFQTIKTSQQWIQIEKDPTWKHTIIEITDYLSKII